MTHLNFSLKKLRKTFELLKDLLKTEMNHNKVYAECWRDRKHEWMHYVKNDSLCTVFSCARKK